MQWEAQLWGSAWKWNRRPGCSQIVIHVFAMPDKIGKQNHFKFASGRRARGRVRWWNRRNPPLWREEGGADRFFSVIQDSCWAVGLSVCPGKRWQHGARDRELPQWLNMNIWCLKRQLLPICELLWIIVQENSCFSNIILYLWVLLQT